LAQPARVRENGGRDVLVDIQRQRDAFLESGIREKRDGAFDAAAGFDRVQAAQKDKAGWESTVDRMVGHGLEVTDAERTAIIDYLVSK